MNLKTFIDLEFHKIFQIFLSGKFFSKYLENKCNFLNDMFRNLEFGVYFALPLDGTEENTISDFVLTIDSLKSKQKSGGVLIILLLFQNY